MGTLKIIAVACIGLFGFLTVQGQQDVLLRAFQESYVHEYNKRYAEAISVLSKTNDDSYEVNARLGYLQYLNKNYTQSVTSYQQAINSKPYAIEARLGIVKSLSALESWDKVLQQYEEILKIDPQNTFANYWAGVILYNRKKYQQAIKYFEKIVNLYPFDYESNHMLAWTYLNLGRNNDAKKVFQKALLIKPGDTSSLEGLGKVK